MPLLFAPIPVILGLIGMLIYATIYSLAESVFVLGLCALIGSACYVVSKALLNVATRIDRMEVKFLAGALAVLTTMTSIIYFVSDNT
ncbi:MAG TPA: hypothetical protein PK812_12495 [Beijerinckiaceae bacterium]|nr:hypothetical protein [Beijerinckiaceae bacterium]